ncbi:MAG: replication factor C large subunit [Candidatus Micrarchaeota archaeon]
MIFAQKHIPKKIDDVAGNDEAKSHIKQWILNWLRGVRQKPLLIYGPTGIGKTTIAYALKAEFDLELIEINASDLRNAAQIEKILVNAGCSFSLSGKNKLLLIDDVDALQREDVGGVRAISTVLKNAMVPVLLTAENIWDKKIAGIVNEARAIAFRRVSKSSVLKVLKKIAYAEKIEIDDTKLEFIAENCGGDLRSAINDLQAGMSGMRNREKDVFERMKIVFKSTLYKEAREAAWGDIEHEFLKLWIDENIPYEYEKKDDIAYAYNILSRADIFDGRIINRQYWGFLRYSNDLMTAGVSLAKRERYIKFVRYQFPNYLRQMSASSAKRATLKRIGLKIGAKVHCNWKQSLLYLNVIKQMLLAIPECAEFYLFEDDEVSLICGLSVLDLKKEYTDPLKKRGSHIRNLSR